MINFNYTIWILLLPFLMFIFLGLAGHKYFPRFSGIIGTTGLAIITALSYITAYKYFFLTEKIDEAYQKITAANTVWLQLTDKLHIDIGILLDPISVMMLIVVTTVSFMVHIYSLGYMKGEKGLKDSFLSSLFLVFQC
jgi:NADH-quinone oxidoreductase subunit L